MKNRNSYIMPKLMIEGDVPVVPHTGKYLSATKSLFRNLKKASFMCEDKKRYHASHIDRCMMRAVIIGSENAYSNITVKYIVDNISRIADREIISMRLMRETVNGKHTTYLIVVYKQTNLSSYRQLIAVVNGCVQVVNN